MNHVISHNFLIWKDNHILRIALCRATQGLKFTFEPFYSTINSFWSISIPMISLFLFSKNLFLFQDIVMKIAQLLQHGMVYLTKIYMMIDSIIM